MAVLVLFVAIGFAVTKVGKLPKESASVLAKLENAVFIPALVFGTFATEFTQSALATTGKLFLLSAVVTLLCVPLAMLAARLLSRESYLRNIYTYGLTFSNFGFMGIPVVTALFPAYAMQYVVFTLPMWILIYLWGVPFLLRERMQRGFRGILRSLCTPMFAAMVIGAVIGLLGFGLPKEIQTVAEGCSGCMSPVAMLLTGILFAQMDYRKVFSSVGIYIASILRLLVLPALFAGLFLLFRTVSGVLSDEYYFVCLLCALSMPLGFNTVVIPAAYGKDTTMAAGMALVSHLLSIGTIPLMLFLFL